MSGRLHLPAQADAGTADASPHAEPDAASNASSDSSYRLLRPFLNATTEPLRVALLRATVLRLMCYLSAALS